LIAWLVGAALIHAAEDEAANPSGTAENPAQPEEDLNKTLIPPTVGMHEVYRVRYAGELQVKTADKQSPLDVTIENVYADESSKIYEIRYSAVRGGTFDLRDYLVATGSDGEPLHPMKVDVQTILGDSPVGDLWSVAKPKVQQPLRYRLLLVLIATLWSIPLVWVGLRHFA
jgi:hypothetical protein